MLSIKYRSDNLAIRRRTLRSYHVIWKGKDGSDFLWERKYKTALKRAIHIAATNGWTTDVLRLSAMMQKSFPNKHNEEQS